MSTEQNQLAAVPQPRTVKEYLALPNYRQRFEETLQNRAAQFMSSLITLSTDPNLARCDPKSVIGGAMIAATLDLPLEKSLGYAHLVPYGDKAQFQLGWKSYVQLAHRSGQYARLNAKPVNQEAFKGYDEVGEPIIDWSKLDETLPCVGYVFAFKLVNGFAKVAYWPKAKVEAHAKRFSQAYKKGRQDSPWFSNFDSMAIKTIVMNELRQWGILSVQMQTALKHDQAAVSDVGAEPMFVDGESATPTEDSVPGDPPSRPRTPSRKGANSVKNVTPAPTSATAQSEEPMMRSDTAAAPAPVTDEPPPPAPTPRTDIKDGEHLNVAVEVVSLECGRSNNTPTVLAVVKGEYEGAIRQIGGAVEKDGELLPEAPWVVGARLRVALLGRESKVKPGTVIAWCQRVEVVS